MSRFDRHKELFGTTGQSRIRDTHVVVVGAGGVGSHVIQQLAYLGVGGLTPIDPDFITETSLNRLVFADRRDVGKRKVDIAKRAVGMIDESITVNTVPCSLFTEEASGLVAAGDVVFGCVDLEGTRLALTELCSAFERPYFDISSDVLPAEPIPEFGGQVCITWRGEGCLVCRGLLDVHEAALQLAGKPGWDAYRRVYGIDPSFLNGGGPSVVSVNGVVASLAVTEFMAAVTGMREPRPLLTYRGWRGGVSLGDPTRTSCYYCEIVRGLGDRAGWNRYLREGLDSYLSGSADALAS